MPPKLPFSVLTFSSRPLSTLRHASTTTASTTPKSQATPSDPTPQQTSPQPQPEKHKTQAQLDLELREKLEGISGEGGAAGLELEGGVPVAMKRGVRSNMFRVI